MVRTSRSCLLPGVPAGHPMAVGCVGSDAKNAVWQATCPSSDPRHLMALLAIARHHAAPPEVFDLTAFFDQRPHGRKL